MIDNTRHDNDPTYMPGDDLAQHDAIVRRRAEQKQIEDLMMRQILDQGYSHSFLCGYLAAQKRDGILSDQPANWRVTSALYLWRTGCPPELT